MRRKKSEDKRATRDGDTGQSSEREVRYETEGTDVEIFHIKGMAAEGRRLCKGLHAPMGDSGERNCDSRIVPALLCDSNIRTVASSRLSIVDRCDNALMCSNSS